MAFSPWPAAGPATTDVEQWDDTVSTQLTCRSGSMHVFGLTDGQSTEPGLASPPAETDRFHARVSRRGGSAEKTVEDMVFDLHEAGWPVGTPGYLEQWRLQLRPT